MIRAIKKKNEKNIPVTKRVIRYPLWANSAKRSWDRNITANTYIPFLWFGTSVSMPLPMLNCSNKKETIIKTNSNEETNVAMFRNMNFLPFSMSNLQEVTMNARRVLYIICLTIIIVGFLSYLPVFWPTSLSKYLFYNFFHVMRLLPIVGLIAFVLAYTLRSYYLMTFSLLLSVSPFLLLAILFQFFWTVALAE